MRSLVFLFTVASVLRSPLPSYILSGAEKSEQIDARLQNILCVSIKQRDVEPL